MPQIPTQITFRHLAHSDALEADIRTRVGVLEQLDSAITSCRVTVEMPHRHRQHGRAFHVRVELSIPGRAPVVVNHTPSLHGVLKHGEEGAHHKESEVDADHRHAYVAVREAFDAAERQLHHLLTARQR